MCIAIFLGSTPLKVKSHANRSRKKGIFGSFLFPSVYVVILYVLLDESAFIAITNFFDKL